VKAEVQFELHGAVEIDRHCTRLNVVLFTLPRRRTRP
jgi:hypothetical protein